MEAVAVILLPAAWGGLMYGVFEFLDRRRRRFRRDDIPPIDYSI